MDWLAQAAELLRFIADLALYVVDLALHIDVQLFSLVATYGNLTYLLLFLIVFCETGLVVTPFLPGDSLLFAAGALAGAGALSYAPLLALLFSAAVLGDQLNYSIGRHLGRAAFEKQWRFLKREHLLAAQSFYDRHGGKAIILARFIPVIRTFAPFVAGIGHMRRARFALFNVAGAVLWCLGLLSAGFFLGNHPWVQAHFSVVIYGIVLISAMPVALETTRAVLKRRNKAGKGREEARAESEDKK